MSLVPALPLVLTHKLYVSSSSTFRQSSMHYSCSDTEEDTPSSSPLPVLPKGSVSFHSNTPIMEIILPFLCNANEFIVLQVCAHLWCFLFISHVTCICIKRFKLGPRWSWFTGRNSWNAFVLLSVALLLTHDFSPGSGHLSLTPLLQLRGVGWTEISPTL